MKTTPAAFSWFTLLLTFFACLPAMPASSSAEKVLAGKVAIVTGSSANLGRGYAVALARMGADVVVHYHTEQFAGRCR